MIAELIAANWWQARWFGWWWGWWAMVIVFLAVLLGVFLFAQARHLPPPPGPHD